jgi:hypothetical protein
MAPEPTLEIDDAIVLLLGAPSKSPRMRDRLEGITRLEKLIFLLERESRAARWLSERGDFVPHNFGPFSKKVYQEIDTLVAAGLVEDSAVPASNQDDAWESTHVIGEKPADPYATRNFTLTADGRRYYSALLGELPREAEDTLSEFKGRFGSIPLRQLIRYVYERYPEQTTRSIIRDDVLQP